MDLRPAQRRNVSARLHENVELRVEIEAYPPPQVRWSKDSATIKGDKTIITRQEHETRWDIGLKTPQPSLDLKNATKPIEKKQTF